MTFIELITDQLIDCEVEELVFENMIYYIWLNVSNYQMSRFHGHRTIKLKKN